MKDEMINEEKKNEEGIGNSRSGRTMRRGNFWNIDRVMALFIGILISAGAIWLLHRLSDVLLPFFAACLISYLMNPLVRFLQIRVGIRVRALAVVITFLLVGGVLAGVVYLCIPMIAGEIDTLEKMVRYYLSHSDKLPVLPDWLRPYLSGFRASDITRYLDTSHIGAILSKGSNLLSTSIGSLLRIASWLLMFVYIIFILLDYDQITRGFKKIFPAKVRPQAMTVVSDMERAMNGYFRGQGFVALCACVLYCVGFSIVGLPLAIVMGLLVGILYMIPYFQYITLIPVALICFISALAGDTGFWTELWKCLLVYVVVQCICDYIITPHVMGREMGLNPAMILLALSVWGSLLGILGMIIALPATSLILSYYERYVSNRGAASEEENQKSDDALNRRL